jgi:hypothetical protein
LAHKSTKKLLKNLSANHEREKAFDGLFSSFFIPCCMKEKEKEKEREREREMRDESEDKESIKYNTCSLVYEQKSDERRT